MVKVIVRDRETIQEAVRRFGKLVMRSGLKKEMRRRKYYEKPSDIKRRARIRAERRSLKSRLDWSIKIRTAIHVTSEVHAALVFLCAVFGVKDTQSDLILRYAELGWCRVREFDEPQDEARRKRDSDY